MAIRLGDGILSILGDFSQLNKDLKTFSRGAGILFTAAGAAITASVIKVIKASTNFESAFAGVKKTVEASEEDFKKLADSILELSERLPVSTTELAKLVEIGGQLGIANESLIDFAETMAGLAISTNIAGEEGALMVARFAAVSGLADEEIPNFASALVELGNTTATTENDILQLAVRLGAAARTIGLSANETLAFAATISSLGPRAELGATALSRLFNKMNEAVKESNEDLAVFSEVTGLMPGLFQSLFKRMPARAIQLFIKGLREIELEGGSVTKAMSGLNLEGFRTTFVMQALTAGQQDLRNNLIKSDKAFTRNTALQEEVGKRVETTDSQFRILMNTISNTAKVLGDELLPIVKQTIEDLKPIVNDIRDWIKLNPELAATITKVVLVGGLLLTFVGILLLALPGLVIAISGVKTAFIFLVSPIGAAVIFFIGALIFVIKTLIENWDLLKKEAILTWNAIRDSVTSAGKAIEKTVTNIVNSAAKAIQKLRELIGLNKKAAPSEVGLEPGRPGGVGGRRALGGVVNRNQVVRVGERGEEKVVLPSGSNVVSNQQARKALERGAGTGKAVEQVVFDFRGTIIEKDADVDVLVSKLTEKWRTLVDQQGGSTATIL